MPRDVSGVSVGPSRIHGLGAFAARAFAAGEVVLALDDGRVVDAAHPLRAELGEYEHHCDYLAGGRVVLQPWPERHVNSSCDPNTVVRTGADGVRRVLARRAIAAGEELTYDYLLNCHGGIVWQCACGSPRCRGTVPGSFFDLPTEQQRRLASRLDGWFVAEHRDRLAALGGLAAAATLPDPERRRASHPASHVASATPLANEPQADGEVNMGEEAPRAGVNEDGTFGPYYRLRCVCCGAPTLGAPDWVDPQVEYAAWPQVCVLCEWENDDPREPGPPTRDDGGVGLDEARANFARHGWMFDPAAPPAWMLALPTAVEAAERRRLVALYREIDGEPEGRRFYDLWEAAVAAEGEVRRLTAARERPDDPGDPGGASGSAGEVFGL